MTGASGSQGQETGRGAAEGALPNVLDAGHQGDQDGVHVGRFTEDGVPVQHGRGEGGRLRGHQG